MRSLAAAITFVAVAVAASAAEAPQFEVHLVTPCRPETQAYSLVATGEQLCLSPQYIIGAAAVVRAQRGAADGVVDIRISPTAFEELHDAAIDAPSSRVGVVFDSRLIGAGAIAGLLKTQSIELDLSDDPDDADALINAFPGTQATK